MPENSRGQTTRTPKKKELPGGKKNFFWGIYCQWSVPAVWPQEVRGGSPWALWNCGCVGFLINGNVQVIWWLNKVLEILIHLRRHKYFTISGTSKCFEGIQDFTGLPDHKQKVFFFLLWGLQSLEEQPRSRTSSWTEPGTVTQRACPGSINGQGTGTEYQRLVPPLGLLLLTPCWRSPSSRE